MKFIPCGVKVAFRVVLGAPVVVKLFRWAVVLATAVFDILCWASGANVMPVSLFSTVAFGRIVEL